MHDLLVVRGACMALLNWGRRTDESGVSAWQICVPARAACESVCRSPRHRSGVRGTALDFIYKL